MFDNSKSLSSDETFTEDSVDEDFHSSNSTQTIISQNLQHTDIVEDKIVVTSIETHEKDHLLTKEREETIQIIKCNNENEDISAKTPNNSQEESTCMHVEETHQTLKGEVGPTRKSSKKPKRPLEKKRKLSFLDSVISMCLVGPLAISVWRGIWTWLDLHAELFPGWICFLFGTILHVIFTIYKYRLCYIVTSKWAVLNWQKRVCYRALCVLYIYMFGVSCITQWRGGWLIIDDYFCVHAWITPCATCLLLVCLAILRSIRNLLATPMLLFIDAPSYVFMFPTRYNVNTRDWSLYLLDCAFSVGVVGTLVVFVWRGIWILLDMYLFPENFEYSTIGSLAIGYVIVAVVFCLQPLMRYICTHLQGLTRLMVADAFLLLSFLGTINVWRGIWNALDLWLLPDNRELSCWITNIGCFIFLVLLNCSNTILVRGVYIDAEEEEGRCVVFPCHYLRLFFKIEREKKQARQKQKLLVATQDLDGRSDVNEKDGENGTLLPNNTAVTIIPANADSLA